MTTKRPSLVSPALACDRIRALCAPAGRLVAVVPAAGKGQRSGLSIPKQYHRVAGKSVLARSVRALADFAPIEAVLVVLDPQDTLWEEQGIEQELDGISKVVAVKIGGASRRDSVLAGCQLVQQAVANENCWVMVHDAARPGVDHESLARLWASVGSNAQACGAILALPLADTIKRAQEGVSAETLNRNVLWAAQTPQCFPIAQLIEAYAQNPDATDEASAIEAAGGLVQLVMGIRRNFKLTEPDDFVLMEALMAQTDVSFDIPFSIGQGFDVHALVEGRPLIIGGVTIPFHKGLAGHSDADVLLHAITDAILGAAGLGDIGRHFPDTDPAYKGADSAKLLEVAAHRVGEAGWRVCNIDCTVIAQAPKIVPHAPAMAAVISKCCGVPASHVNIKGKTTEQLGFVGRGEGIAAQAVAMLARKI
jgi:2-C-methyl-D-erythritol 4-phosphate cytidylyltransferase / 2-C-methyl-D-erythritol 2,4-cyclodiphosphate synthase